jgi:hypothetical protein
MESKELMKRMRAAPYISLAVCVLATHALSQVGESGHQSALLSPELSSVYVKFRRTGKGTPVKAEESRERIWLTLKNNTRWTIRVSTFGLPEGHGRREVGLMYKVVQMGDTIADSPLPSGAWFEVGSYSEIEPGGELPFSVAKNHLVPGLGISIDFRFLWEQNGRFTRYSSVYSYWDLPDSARDKALERKLEQRMGLKQAPLDYDRSPLPDQLSTPASDAVRK